MEHPRLHQFTDTIDRIAEYFPHQHGWQQLKQKFVREYKTHIKKSNSSASANRCQCCGKMELADNGVFCGECLRFFSIHSSNIVLGQCDCGHFPRGSNVFLFHPYGRMQSLCSIECVKKLYHKLFGILLDKLK